MQYQPHQVALPNLNLRRSLAKRPGMRTDGAPRWFWRGWGAAKPSFVAKDARWHSKRWFVCLWNFLAFLEVIFQQRNGQALSQSDSWELRNSWDQSAAVDFWIVGSSNDQITSRCVWCFGQWEVRQDVWVLSLFSLQWSTFCLVWTEGTLMLQKSTCLQFPSFGRS